MINATEEKVALPNSLPRPKGEEEQLLRIWYAPTGWRWFTAVNNTTVGLLYMGAAFAFFVLAGLVALVMRTQLAVPENHLVSQGFAVSTIECVCHLGLHHWRRRIFQHHLL